MYDKSVSNFTLNDVQDYKLVLDVTFQVVKDITPVLLDPDRLLIHIIDPSIIIDAETFEPLGET